MLDFEVSAILMRQLPLPLSAAAQPSLDNYVAGANAEALEGVRALAQGRLKEAIVYLWGAPGSGRSHLLAAAASANPALVIADDVDALSEAAQQALFIAINSAREGGPAVLAAGAAPPARLGLREHLRTRLGWGLVYQLKPLTDADKALHLRSEAQRRGLSVSDDVVRYLLNHLPRDLASLHAVLDRLDRHSLARQRAVTLALVRDALSRNDDG
jgi:DnaA-homolog protein